MATIRNVLPHSHGTPTEPHSSPPKITSKYGTLQNNMDLIVTHNSKATITISTGLSSPHPICLVPYQEKYLNFGMCAKMVK